MIRQCDSPACFDSWDGAGTLTCSFDGALVAEQVVAVYPSYPAAGFDCDRSGIEPIRVMVEGERLRHPRPLRAEEGYAEEGQGDGGKG